MELSFIVAAVRRRPWLLFGCMALGLLPGLLAEPGTPKYESVAVLLVSPPAQGANALASSSDRYVANQLSVLRDTGLAERVATAAGAGLSTDDVKDAVTIAQRPGTDLVEVRVLDEVPDRAKAIADLYVDTYVSDLRTRTTANQEPELKAIEAELTRISQALEDVNNEMRLAVAAFVPDPSVPASPNAQQIPGIDALRPDLVTSQNLLITQYQQQLDNRNQLSELAKLRVTSEVVESATLPVIPVAESNKLVLIGGLFAGTVVGLVACGFAAAASRRVLDEAHAEEILDVAFVGRLPRDRTLTRDPARALTELPRSFVGVVDQLTVRTGALAAEGRGLTIAVAGTAPGSSSAIVALSIAGTFARAGSRVVLVDLVAKLPTLSTVLPVSARHDVGTLLARAEAGAAKGGGRLPQPYGTTPEPDVRFVSAGATTGAVLRRHQIEQILTVASHDFDVVIVDGGGVLDAASTLHLCDVADAVVLAVPIGTQDVAPLEVIGRELARRRGEILPVAVVTSRWASLLDRHAASGAATTAHPGVVVESGPTTPVAPVSTQAVDRAPRPRPTRSTRASASGDHDSIESGGTARPARPPRQKRAESVDVQPVTPAPDERSLGPDARGPVEHLPVGSRNDER